MRPPPSRALLGADRFALSLDARRTPPQVGGSRTGVRRALGTDPEMGSEESPGPRSAVDARAPPGASPPPARRCTGPCRPLGAPGGLRVRPFLLFAAGRPATVRAGVSPRWSPDRPLRPPRSASPGSGPRTVLTLMRSRVGGGWALTGFAAGRARGGHPRVPFAGAQRAGCGLWMRKRVRRRPGGSARDGSAAGMVALRKKAGGFK